MARKYFIVDTLSGGGAFKVPVTPSQAPWSNALNAITGASATILLDDEVSSLMPWDVLTVDWDCTFVVEHDDAVIYAGLMQAVEVDFTTSTMTFEHSTLRALFKKRTTLGDNGYGGIDGGKHELLNQTLASIAGRLVWAGMLGPTDGYPLPIVLPAVAAGGHDRTYRDWNFPVVDDELTLLTNVAGGPDVDFRARWTPSGTLEWEMRTGALTGPAIGWDMTALEGTNLSSVKVKIDGRLRVTNTYATGSGAEILLPVKWARASSVPGVALDSMEQASDEVDDTVLQQLADGAYATYKQSTTQWSASMVDTGAPGLSSLVLGQPALLKTPKLGPIPAGLKTLRLIGFAGDTSSTVTLSFQPGGA